MGKIASLELLAAKYSEKLIYQIIYISFINVYLLYRCFEKVFEKERYENKKGKSRDVTTNYIQWKGDRIVKDWDDEILGFDFVFGG